MKVVILTSSCNGVIVFLNLFHDKISLLYFHFSVSAGLTCGIREFFLVRDCALQFLGTASDLSQETQPLNTHQSVCTHCLSRLRAKLPKVKIHCCLLVFD
jgi:hypothetical protein